jgi:hypothetical protein
MRHWPISGLLAGALLCGCGKDPLALSDREATRIIEPELMLVFTPVPLGHLAVVGDGRVPNLPKGEITEHLFSTLAVWDRLGLIKITEKRDLTGRFSGWDNWFALSQRGVVRTLNSVEGPKGRGLRCSGDIQMKVGKSYYGELPCLCVPTGTPTVERIIRNDLRSVGVEYYRIVIGEYSESLSTFTKEFQIAFTKGEWRAGRNRFIAVLKHDPFSGKWKLVESRKGRPNQEIDSSFVRDILKAN